MTRRLDIEGLRALVAISTHGGVTRAAEHLALSQPAVSHKIRRLEHALDCQLLARRTGGPLFTQAGTRLLEYARRMMNLHDEALASLGKKLLSGTLRLGMTEDTTGGDIARIIGRFMQLYPKINVSTKIEQSLTLSNFLKNGEIDIAVIQVLSDEVRGDDIILYKDRLHWIKSPDLPLAANKSIPFLAFDQNCFYKHWVQSAGSGMGHKFETALECPSVSGILSAARAGLGVALMNDLHITSDLEVIEGVFPVPPKITYVARTIPKNRSDVVRALLHEITEEVGRPASLRVA